MFAFRRCRIDILLRAVRRCKYHDYRPGARDDRDVVLYSVLCDRAEELQQSRTYICRVIKAHYVN